MKFAIISDIHGNLPALNAVLEDANNNNIDNFIFVGDYCLSNPYPNECIQRIRCLDKKHIIRGNQEKYLENLIDKDQKTWTDGQMQILYYCYRAISADNLNFILSMPKVLKFTCNGVDLHIAHSSEEFIEDCEHKEWSTQQVAKRYKDKDVTSDSFRADIHNYFDNNDRFQQIFSELEQGVYIFGHSHIQWSYQSTDEKTVLINPGSCGLPLDGVIGSIPYAILDISDTGNIIVEEKRIPFDMEEYISVFIKSDQFVKANIWSKIIVQELRTAREHMLDFLKFAEEYADKIADKRRPFMLDTWEKAYALWSKQ
ncbi:MAG: metallophosphatase family protein [Candidatus Gastranaerophilales bacterium]|nr:metallophosphatase family protein [Candidatus Gastranaerophilales bacterium]